MPAMSAFARLDFRLSLARSALRQQAAQLWQSGPPRVIYPAYLQQMHMIVRSAVPLLESAAAEAGAHAGDPLNDALVDYYSRHAEEERGHDRWLLEDLEATDSGDWCADAGLPPPCVAEMVGAQYYWLRHFHPVTLLGHVAAMETYPPPLDFAPALQAMTGYPPRAFSTIRRHARLDIGHARDLERLVDSLPLAPAHEAAIAASALHTIERGIDVLAQLESRVRNLPATAAASEVERHRQIA